MDEVIEIFGKRLKIVQDESDSADYCYDMCDIGSICYSVMIKKRVCEDAEGKMNRHFECVKD